MAEHDPGHAEAAEGGSGKVAVIEDGIDEAQAVNVGSGEHCPAEPAADDVDMAGGDTGETSADLLALPHLLVP